MNRELKMTPKVTAAIRRITEILRSWGGIDSVACIESGDDSYDPYFFVSLDVYLSGAIPDVDDRKGQFHDTAVFESSTVTKKDRFLVDGLPVRLEYKEQQRFNELIAAAEMGEPRFRDSGTYAFYRLAHADVLLSRSPWIDEVRERIRSLPDSFWQSLGDVQRARAEHTYGDLAAAVARGDDLFFLVSSARFIRTIIAWVFALNHEFQPSDRLILDKISPLKELPPSFLARIENFVRQDGSLTLEQRRELAELLVTSALSLTSA